MLQSMHALTTHPAYEVLIREIEAAREKYFVNLARGLAMRNGPVDQREIDEKRGFWKGAIWALKTFPALGSKEFEKLVEEALKEADEHS